MVIAGKIRSNAPQLASYLLTQADNERITILDVDGRENADAAELKEMLYSMELNSELTRTRNSVYHAYINPNPEDTTDRAMSMEEWQQSVDILTKQLGYEDQRKVVVLHEKQDNRVHAHIVYERYNHERGTVITYEHNYKAHDRARAEMERKLSHKPTPQKNKNRGHHKEQLTAIWHRTNTAREFIQEAKTNGYQIAKGTSRPYQVIDADGVAFDLVRKLDGVKTAEVKQRFGDTELMPEKEAIKQQQQAKQERKKPEQETQSAKDQQEQPQQQPVDAVIKNRDTTDNQQADAREQARQKFLQNIKDVRERNRSVAREITFSVIIALRVCFSFKDYPAEKRGILKQRVAFNAKEITIKQQQKPPDKMLGFIEAAQFYKPT